MTTGFQGVDPGEQSGSIPVSGGGGDPDPFAGSSAAVQSAYNQELLDPRNVAGNMQSSAATSAAVAAMTPAERQAYSQRWLGQNTGGFWNTVNDKVLPAALLAVASGGVGAGVAGAVGGGLAGGVAGGAAAGTASSVGNSLLNDSPITLGSVGKGTAIGALSGGLSYAAQPLTNAATGLGLPSAISAGLIRGGIGAGIGAGVGALTGSGAGRGAEIGGIGGAASGVAGNLSSSPAVGTAAGTIAGSLANKYLPPPSGSQAPSTPGTLPSLPGMTSGSSTGSSVVPAGNIGAYSGFSQGADPGLGYAPRTQIQNPVQNYATYGQGPEAQFFSGERGAPAPNVGIQVVPTSPQQRI